LRLAIDLTTILVSALIWFGIVGLLRLRKKANPAYLLFFTVFYVYLYKVLDYTLFQFQSLLLLRHFMPDLILQGQTAGNSTNLIPLVALTIEDLKTSLLNILLLIPFGFALPFITNLHMQKTVVAGALFSVAIEALQFATGWFAGTTFRIADINDVILNTVGVALGYVLFAGFVRIVRRVSFSRKVPENPIIRHIAERPQVAATPVKQTHTAD
jgi:glycopeptide antibiotics resistance protein